jgi:hypothetical protein
MSALPSIHERAANHPATGKAGRAPRSFSVAFGPARLHSAFDMTTARLLLVIALVAFGSSAYSSPESDLSSPSQAKRDAAATLLRATYVPTPRTNWNSVENFVRTNHSRAELLKRLHGIPHRTEPSNGEIFWEYYRLDSSWELSCSYGAKDQMRKGYWLKLHHAWVAPPTKFTGSWVTYYANGQKCWESQYKDGRKLECLEYEEDGAKGIRHIHHQSGTSSEVWYGADGRPNFCVEFGANGEPQARIDYNDDGSTITNRFKQAARP